MWKRLNFQIRLNKLVEFKRLPRRWVNHWIREWTFTRLVAYYKICHKEKKTRTFARKAWEAKEKGAATTDIAVEKWMKVRKYNAAKNKEAMEFVEKTATSSYTAAKQKSQHLKEEVSGGKTHDEEL